MPSIFSQPVSFERFREIAFHFAKACSADILLGSPDHPGSAGSYIAVDPVDELVLKASCPADEVEAALKDFSFAGMPVLGFICYECGLGQRGVNSSKKSDFPLLHFRKYRTILEHAGLSGELRCLHGGAELAELESFARDAGPLPEMELPHFQPESVKKSLDCVAYEEGVRRTLDYIRDGLTYQLNLSTRFDMEAELDPVLWFFALNRKYPAPYYALFRSGEQVIVSTSPELFLRVEQGQVLSEPIKGTQRFDQYSAELVEQLTSSVKEDSELSMIVDLIRNDISANCSYGSVVVEDHKSVFAVDNLLQMFSRVRGKLAGGKDCIDLLLDAFPGGSITGCPKKSSMELIDRLEPHVRGPYCGSIVLINGPQDMVSSIAIRTAVYDESTKKVSYWAGSGIVVDSDPQAEYLETIAKAGKILDPEGM